MFRHTLTAVLLASTAAAAMAADRFTSDADHTFASFSFNHLNYSEQRGRFDKVDAVITLDREQRTGQVDVTIDVPSISTGSAAFNKVLLGEPFFDAAKFPQARFTGTALTFDKFDHIASVAGELTIKGKTLPVTLQLTHYHCMMHPLLKREACGANATAKISRSAFGLGKFTPLVGDEVTISVVIEALKAE